LTQEQLAGLLGVGRSYTTRVIGRFKVEAWWIRREGDSPSSITEIWLRWPRDSNDVVCGHFNMVLKGVDPDP